jgi:hypothetical protein
LANALETEKILLTLPSKWTKVIDEMVSKHLYGATNRQDIIKAILAPTLNKEA